MKKLSKLETVFRFGALVVLAVAAFAGVMSVITGDPVVRYTIAGIVVFFASKELI